jgi:hypothetical protein
MPDDNKTADLAWLIAKGRIGKSIAIEEAEIRNPFSLYNSLWSGEVRKGKRWVTAAFGEKRLNSVQGSTMNGVFEGGVWCRAEDKADASKALASFARDHLRGMIEDLQRSIDSLDEELRENDIPPPPSYG